MCGNMATNMATLDHGHSRVFYCHMCCFCWGYKPHHLRHQSTNSMKGHVVNAFDMPSVASPLITSIRCAGKWVRQCGRSIRARQQKHIQLQSTDQKICLFGGFNWVCDAECNDVVRLNVQGVKECHDSRMWTLHNFPQSLSYACFTSKWWTSHKWLTIASWVPPWCVTSMSDGEWHWKHARSHTSPSVMINWLAWNPTVGMPMLP